MENLGAIEFFEKIGYNWKIDYERIKDICFYTKSRIAENKSSADFELAYGMEQPFVLKAIADFAGAENFYEIGTGRGTGSYAVSLSETVKTISTVDIIPYTHKRNEAIGYDAAFVSNADLYDHLNFSEKKKINFYERKDFGKILQSKPELGYDLFFIDGNHTDFDIIAEDFLMCQILASENPIIIWDDFYQDKFAIKDVVFAALKANKDFKAFLLSSRGHLFTEKNSKQPEENCGMVVMLKEEAYENLFTQS